MIRRHSFSICVTAVLMTLSLLSSAVTAQPEAAPATSGSEDTIDLDRQFAQTYLRLAEAQLRRAESMNQQIAQSVSDDQIEELKADYELAEQLVHKAEQGGTGGYQGIYLRFAQLAYTRAQQELDRAREAKRLDSQSVGDTDLEILQLRAQLAKINLAKGKRALAGPLEEGLNWKIGLLYQEVIRLRAEVEMLKQRG